MHYIEVYVRPFLRGGLKIVLLGEETGWLSQLGEGVRSRTDDNYILVTLISLDIIWFGLDMVWIGEERGWFS